eukprot:TRINITY_DN22280_c0_g1_i1.p1 TRINITY_DN22280_c0_g1~~TRINITY_DN22280_c0_g1_i1.p1  ORF type:complete len:528 (+),score=46.47 TRINITY_DN22280_c0_g1_i1:234-1586(+)
MDSEFGDRQFFIGFRRMPAVSHGVQSVSEQSLPDAAIPTWLNSTNDESRGCADEMGSARSEMSLPRTTVTGRIFHAVGNEDDLAARISEMRAVVESEQWYIPPANVKVYPDEILGRGCFGVVGDVSFHGASVAVKVPLLAENSLKTMNKLINELRILRRARHPNLVQFFGALIDTNKRHLGLVLELVPGSSLDAFQFSGCVNDGTVQRFHVITGMANALAYLHSLAPIIVHGDLTPSNVIIEKRDQFLLAKLLDFGLSYVLTAGTSRQLSGTVRWMAPEVVQRRDVRPSPSSDVFSLGYLLYYTMTGWVPFARLSIEEVMQCHLAGIAAELTWPLKSAFEVLVKDLTGQCLRPMHRRPRILEIQRALVAWRSCSDPQTSNNLEEAQSVAGTERDFVSSLADILRPGVAMSEAHSSSYGFGSDDSLQSSDMPSCSSQRLAEIAKLKSTINL